MHVVSFLHCHITGKNMGQTLERLDYSFLSLVPRLAKDNTQKTVNVTFYLYIVFAASDIDRNNMQVIVVAK